MHIKDILCHITNSSNNVSTTSFVASTPLDENDLVAIDPNDSTKVIKFTGDPGQVVLGFVVKNVCGSEVGDCVDVQIDGAVVALASIKKAVGQKPLNIRIETLADGTCVIKYCDADGSEQQVDASKFLDDTDLPRIVSGVINADGDLVLEREDGTIVTVDLPDPQPDVVETTYDPATGEVTVTVNGVASTFTIPPDQDPVVDSNFDEATCELTISVDGVDTVIALPESDVPTFDPLTCEIVYPRKGGEEERFAITNINTGFDDTTVGTDQFVNLLGHDAQGKAVPVAFPPEKEIKKVWTIDLSGENGVDEEYWDSNGTGVGEPQPSADDFPDIDDIFYQSNGCTIQHPNALAPDQVLVNPTFRNLDPADADIAHQSRIESYLHVPAGGRIVRFTMAGQASSVIYLASCSDKLARQNEFKNTASGQQVVYESFLPQGIYHVVGFIHDGGSAGALIGQWSSNGGASFPGIPAENLFRTHPVIEAHCVWVEYGSDELTNLDGTPLDLTDKELAICDPCENTIQGGDEDECFVVDMWTIDTDAPKGVTERFWDSDRNAIGGPVAPSQTPTIPNIFTSRNGCGQPRHPLEETPDDLNLLPIFDSTDPNLANFTHQNELISYLYVPEDGTELLVQAGGASSNQVYIGVCNGKQGLVANDVSGTQSIGIYSRGIYAVRGLVHDPGTFGRIEVRWRQPGQTVQDIPADNWFLNLPPIICRKVLIKKGSRNRFDLDGRMLDANLALFECNPCDNLISADTTNGAQDETKSVVISNERIVVDAATDTTQALTVPDGAAGAIIQVIIDDPTQQGGCINYYANGATATATAGYRAGHKEYLDIGCVASNGALAGDPATEVSDFVWHVGQVTSGEVILEVTYYTS